MNPPKDLPVTQIFKTQWLDVGDYYDFETPKFSIHIVLNDIVQEELPLSSLSSTLHKQLAAKLSFDVQGHLYGGPGTKKLSTREYLVPVGGGNNQEFYTLYLYYLGENRAVLCRIFVKHINPQHEKQN